MQRGGILAYPAPCVPKGNQRSPCPSGGNLFPQERIYDFKQITSGLMPPPACPSGGNLLVRMLRRGGCFCCRK